MSFQISGKQINRSKKRRKPGPHVLHGRIWNKKDSRGRTQERTRTRFEETRPGGQTLRIRTGGVVAEKLNRAPKTHQKGGGEKKGDRLILSGKRKRNCYTCCVWSIWHHLHNQIRPGLRVQGTSTIRWVTKERGFTLRLLEGDLDTCWGTATVGLS